MEVHISSKHKEINPKDWEFHCSEDVRKRKRLDNMWKTRGSGETIGSSSKFAHLSVEFIVGDVSTNSSIPIDELAMAIVESEPSILPINQLNVSSISEPLASTTPLVIPPITSTSNIVSDSEFYISVKKLVQQFEHLGACGKEHTINRTDFRVGSKYPGSMPSHSHKSSDIEIQADQLLRLSASRSVQEIVQLVDCITQKKSSDYQVLLCAICVSISEKDITINLDKFRKKQPPGIFLVADVDINIQDDQLGERINLSRTFINLKRSIKRHLELQSHVEQVEKKGIEDAQAKKLLQRETQVGLTLGLKVYQILYEGDSFRRFEREVSWLHMIGVDLGNINHSEHFCRSLLPFLRNEICSKMIQLMATNLGCTGN